ncbi:SCO4226 family nickel-binding protein [Streptomyces adustus]
MPQFMDIHHGMQGITADQLDEAHKADLAIEADEQVHFERAWADPATGTVYCLSEAPSAEAVQRVHERAGHKADEIHAVPLSVW